MWETRSSATWLTGFHGMRNLHILGSFMIIDSDFLTVSYATPNALRVGIATIFSVQGAEFAKPWATEVEKKDGIL